MTAGVTPCADHGWLARLLAGDPRAQRVLNLVRAVPADRWDVLMRYGDRLEAGMPGANAAALLREECGLPAA